MKLRFFIDFKSVYLDKITVIKANQDDDDYSYYSCDTGCKYVGLFSEFDNKDQINDCLFNNPDYFEIPYELMNKELIEKIEKKFDIN